MSENGKIEYYQQGDLLLFPVDVYPSGEDIPPVEGRHILLEGEATGHAHAVQTQEGSRLWRDGTTHYLRLLRPAEITHEEHRNFILPPGFYRLGRVLEWDYLREEERDVMD